MQLLLGFFFFSVLLATGNSLMCETCSSTTSDCSGTKIECERNFDTCMAVVAEVKLGQKATAATFKSCSTKEICHSFEEQKGKTSTSPLSVIPVGSTLKDVVCSKAPASFASFFPAFLTLLLVKFLF